MRPSSLFGSAGVMFALFAGLLRLTPAANEGMEVRFFALMIGASFLSIATCVVMEIFRWVKVHQAKNLSGRFEESDWTLARHSGVRR